MRFVSWNVNGLRACLGKGFMQSFKALDADVFGVQETAWILYGDAFRQSRQEFLSAVE